MPAQYSRAVLKIIALEVLLSLTYVWLMKTKLIPMDLRNLSRYQVNKLIASITLIYEVDNKLPLAFCFLKKNCAVFEVFCL